MVDIITILLFFVYTWGLGFSVTYFVKSKANFLERNLMNVGIGLGVFSILSVIINFFRIPLDWKLFLVLSIIIPGYDLYKKVSQKKFNFPKIKLTKSNLTILLVIIIALISFYTYASGAFSYSYLEDEDPWGHAIGVKYVALEKDAYDPPLQNMDRAFDNVLSYVDPYPPAYDVLMGVLHQTSSDLNWTLKFFNALIISLGFIFFFFFAKRFIGNRNKAFWATFVLAIIPCYMSHFIWAHSLVITLFFPAMYCLVMLHDNKRWLIPSAIIIAGIWVSQNVSQPLKISTMIVIYLVVASITQRKFLAKHFIALFSGFALSLFWWGTMVYKYGLRGFASFYNVGGSYAATATTEVATSRSWSLLSIIKALVSPGGSASRAYTFSDFFYAKTHNLINNPIGVGVILSLLVLVGVLFLLWKYRSKIITKDNTWRCVSLFWLIFTFWGVNGQTFPISVARGPFRVWMLMAIAIAFVSVEGIYFFRNLTKSKTIRTFIFLLIVIGLVWTSGYQKHTFNTQTWPTSGSFTPQEAAEYGEWFNTIPDNTPVFLYSPRDKLTIGYGKYSCAWCQDILDFRKEILYKDAEQLHQFLTEKNYQYFVINGRMETKYFNIVFGEEETTKLLQTRYNEIINSELFVLVYQKENMFAVFKVK